MAMSSLYSCLEFMRSLKSHSPPRIAPSSTPSLLEHIDSRTMWLLSTSRAELKYFANSSHVRFAILSHVWRDNEQSFQDIQRLQTQYASVGNPRDYTSEKIRRCCLYAEQHGYQWIWVDTCCIDKSSSAELSEAINSMYVWYAEAAICYAFLDDVADDEDPRGSASPTSSQPVPSGTAFTGSKWFTRGWTLQELIAPKCLLFLSRDWRTLGTKYDLADLLETITGVDAPVLRHERPLGSVSVARRMSWAARRQTTRLEDRAYSLMGLFGIHMPTIYGEGAKAFIRLQREIIKHSPDHSIFAWGPIHQSYLSASANGFGFSHSCHTPESRALLASSPDAFEQSADICAWDLHSFVRKLHCQVPDFHLSGYGMRTTLPMLRSASACGSYVYAVMLACKDSRGFPVMLFLQPSDVVSMSSFTVGEYVQDDLAPLVYSYYRAAYLPLGKDAITARIFRNLRPSELYIELQRDALQLGTSTSCHSERIVAPFFMLRSRRPDHTITGASLSGYTFFFPPWVIARMNKSGYTPDRPCDDGMTVELAPCDELLSSPGRSAHIPFSIVTFTNARTKARFSVIFGYRRNTTCGRSLSRGYCPSILVTSAGTPHRESAKSSECLYARQSRVSNFVVLTGLKVVRVEVKEPWDGFRPPRGRLRDSAVHFIDLAMS